MGFENFLSNLGDMLDHQFMTGENKNRTAKLGDFANKYDRSAQRSYTEQGYFRNHLNDPTPKQLDILTQEPEATVLVKKRAFGSLAENFRPDLMDAEERLYLKTTKILFQIKTKQIAAYEMLTKLARVSTQIGEVDYHLLPILFTATDTLSEIGIDLGGFKSTVDQVRKIIRFNQEFKNTTWQTNVNNSLRNDFGEGTGVIEFTNVLSFNTTTTLKFAQGKFNINFADPYNLMVITANDINAAISDASNRLYSNKGFQLLGNLAKDTLDIQLKQLSLLRAGRGANNINFIINPDTFVGKRIRAIVDVAGIEINFQANSFSNIIGSSTIEPAALIGNEQYDGDKFGLQGLAPNEVVLFNNIVSSMYNNLSQQANSKRQIKLFGLPEEQAERLNSLRQRLTLNYCDKPLIQPMDTVSIFVNSKKKLDLKITGGLQTAFNGLKFMQGLGNLGQSIKDLLNIDKGFSVEKSIFVGNDFPNALWLAMRSQFVSDKQGICVFTGVFEEATSSYSNGMYEVSASGSDNAKFFEYGIVNTKPAMDVYNGTLFDPLTPFDLKYDSVSGIESGILKGKDPELLPENKKIFQSAFLKFKNGPLAGSVPTEEGYFNRSNKLNKGTLSSSGAEDRKVFYDPEGLVYRWKRGITSFTLFGPSYQPGNIRGNSLTEDPFAGQDIMNVLSLLITGEPYNYATYYKAATSFNTLARNPITNQTSAASYFRGLRADIKNKNSIYGDFIPFKMLTMDEASFEKIMGHQINAIQYDAELQKLTEERAALSDQLMFLSTNAAASQTVKVRIKEYDSLIQEKINNIYKEVNSTNTPLKILGNDVSYDYNDLNGVSNPTTSTRRELRRKLNFLTRRLAWKVRANEDVNLFIVDDSYDKDYDIQSFEKAFANDLSIFKSEYTTSAQQISTVAEKLKLEVFCNSQGHIEIRSPKYNRMPSSVFYKMFRTKKETGVQIFPKFLEDLLIVQVKDVLSQIEIIEDKIRLYCFVLGKATDNECSQFINTIGNENQISVKYSQFKFLSQENGYINSNIENIRLVAKPEKFEEDFQNELTSQTNLQAFSSVARAKFIQSGAEPPAGISPNQIKSAKEIQSLAAATVRFDQVKARIQNRTGEIFSLNQEFGINPDAAVKITSNNKTALQISNKIAILLSDREKSIRTAVNALKNLKEGETVNSSTGANKLTLPSLTGNKDIPQVFEHMIEDESYDDLGVGSSSRYVIKNRDIISYNITERRPTFTAINVVGKYGDNFIRDNELPPSLNVFNTSGNALATAIAVDYDLWRMYGISLPQQVDAPFMENPVSQLAPYAVSLLNKSRKEVLQGNIDIVGNEYQQPGEVIYIENRDLLFYIDSVSHSFAYGKQFKTSLSVGYGHKPGEYIPTPLDVIGKVLYKNNQILPKLDHKKQGNVFNQENIGAVAVNLPSGGSLFGGGEIDIFTNQFAETNRKILEQVISQAATQLSLKSNTINPILELRIFFNSDNGNFSQTNSELQSFTDELRSYLIGASELNGESTPILSIKKETKRLSNFAKSNQIKVIPVNSSSTEKDEFRYPSRNAFSLARQIAEKTASIVAADDLQVKVDSAIHNSIIDIWIYFENMENKK